ARRDQLDGVRAEHRQVTDVLLPEGEIPAVIRIGFGSIAELVAAKFKFGGRDKLRMFNQRYLAARQVHLAQQPADAEQYPARIVANDEHRRRGSAGVVLNNGVTLGTGARRRVALY